jgi:hypothetical protein
MEHRLGRGGIKNGPKIKIYWYFFVEIEKKNQIIIVRGCKLEKNKNSNKNRTKS